MKSPADRTYLQARDRASTPSLPWRARRLARRSPIPFVVAVVVAIVMILPFATLIISALTPADQMGINRWLPGYLRWSNFTDAVRYIPFWQLAKNSLVLSSIFG